MSTESVKVSTKSVKVSTESVKVSTESVKVSKVCRISHGLVCPHNLPTDRVRDVHGFSEDVHGASSPSRACVCPSTCPRGLVHFHSGSVVGGGAGGLTPRQFDMQRAHTLNCHKEELGKF